MNKLYDYRINKISLFEKFLLLFKRPCHACDKDGNIISVVKYKHLFGKTYILEENISVEKYEIHSR